MYKFKRPIVFFDTETTGVDVVKDRIVQIAVIKINPDGSREEKDVLFNPEMPIPEEASDVHGITDEDVANEPTFSKKAKGIALFFKDCDIAGYNSDKFDIPILSEEMFRCGIDFPEKGTRTIDMYSIEKTINSHKLGETYKRRTGKDLEGAHDASADTNATVDVFFSQAEEMAEKGINIDDIDDIELIYKDDKKIKADFAGNFYYNMQGDLYWNFGKNRDKMVTEDKGYVDWYRKQSFTHQSKTILNDFLESLS